jgi:hypothetical protein
MAVFVKAFCAFGQHLAAKTEIIGKGKPFPVQTNYRLGGFQEVVAPILQDSQHMKVVRL